MTDVRGTQAARRRMVQLLVASGIGAVALLTVVVLYATVWVTTIRASASNAAPCLGAYSDGRPGTRVEYAVLPPASACWWQPDGAAAPERVEVAHADVRVFWPAAAVGVGGFVVALWRGVPVLRRF